LSIFFNAAFERSFFCQLDELRGVFFALIFKMDDFSSMVFPLIKM